MQFISKFKYKKRGHHIVKAFIRECWNKSEQMYLGLDYDGLKRSKKMQRLLLKEQSGYCCYCMRKISLSEVTLEHVMPHNLKEETLKEEVKYYKHYGRLKQVYYAPEIPVAPKLRTPPYPHSIAYENLTASCKGRIFDGSGEYKMHQCCNNPRGNKKIIPLFFLSNISEMIEYEKDGRISDNGDRYKASIDSLKLNHDTLIFMRKIWARIVMYHIEIKQVWSAKDNIEIRRDIIDDIDLERSERQNLKVDTYWKLLIEYHWFYYYFMKRFAA